jgi:hypothetical protein
MFHLAKMSIKSATAKGPQTFRSVIKASSPPAGGGQASQKNMRMPIISDFPHSESAHLFYRLFCAESAQGATWHGRIIHIRFPLLALCAMADEPSRTGEIRTQYMAQAVRDSIEPWKDEEPHSVIQDRLIVLEQAKLLQPWEDESRHTYLSAIGSLEWMAPSRFGQCSGLRPW